MSIEKVNVLLAAHIGEPMGGISINYSNLLNSSLSRRCNVKFVETSKGNLSFSKRGGLRIQNWLNAIINIFGFLQAISIERNEIVHIGSAYEASFAKHSVMALIARFAGLRVIMQLHCSVSRILPENRPLWKFFVLFVLRRINGIVTLSKEWNVLKEDIPNINLCYVPNAIDVRPYQNIIRKHRKKTEKVSILFMGHIGHEKGCFDLLLAIEKLVKLTSSNFCMHFVGETLHHGEKKNLQLEAKRKKLLNWVKIHPPEYGDNKINRFATSDIFVLPSYHEGMPMSVIEAMAAGLPVLGTLVGGIPDQVISEQTGLLLEAGDVQTLTGALLRLVENPAERLRMGKAGRQRAIELFDIEVKVKKLEAFYLQLITA